MNGVKTELFEFIKKNKIETPVALKIRLDSVHHASNGTERYYLYIVAGNRNVSELVAETLGYKSSTSGPYYGDVMVPGANNNAGIEIQKKLYELAERNGYHGMMDTRCFFGRPKCKTGRKKGQATMVHSAAVLTA